jgi:hypothetical protein
VQADGSTSFEGFLDWLRFMASQGVCVVVGNLRPNKVAKARRASPALHARQKRRR